jgi:hypothetical protein
MGFNLLISPVTTDSKEETDKVTRQHSNIPENHGFYIYIHIQIQIKKPPPHPLEALCSRYAEPSKQRPENVGGTSTKGELKNLLILIRESV